MSLTLSLKEKKKTSKNQKIEKDKCTHKNDHRRMNLTAATGINKNCLHEYLKEKTSI